MMQFILSPFALQSAFLLFMVCIIPFEVKKLRRIKLFTSSAARLSLYRSGTASLWLYAAVAIVLASPNDLFTMRHASGDMPWLLESQRGALAAIALLVVFFYLAFAPGVHCVVRPAARSVYEGATRSLQFMLPVTARERRWWALLSISAGICEEVVFRGFLLQFLQGDLHDSWNLDLGAAWLLTALAFGCGHAYQGIAGVARTTVGGLLFGLLAILSGGLLLPIILHALVDLAVLLIYHPHADTPDRAARLVEGCDPRQ